MSSYSAPNGIPSIERSQGCDAYLLDPKASAERVKKSSERLFSQEEGRLELRNFKTHDRAPDRIIITDPKMFSTSLDGTTTSDIATRIFYIYQSYTWSNFEITLELFNALTSYLNVYPTFLDIVQLFGQKPGPVEESFTLFFDHLTPSPDIGLLGNKRCGFEIGYSIKYVERHGRTYPTDPFSIRETGIYHKWDRSEGQHVWIFMQASDTTKAGVERLCSQIPELRQFQIHAAILLGASENWRHYTNYLEKHFSKLVDRSFFAKVDAPVTQGELSVDFSDIQNLQIFTDKLHQISHILMLNMNVGSQIQNFIRATLDFRAVNLSFDTSVKGTEISESLRDITGQGAQENSYMKKMVHQSTRDTRSSDVDEESNDDLTDLAKRARKEVSESSIVASSYSTVEPRTHEIWDGNIR
ncbi:hypothetical protein MMC07_001067 [Pseudocyphellaria aurata]|nr:hypothetical protein [Pseudocyphellaria aurata]